MRHDEIDLQSPVDSFDIANREAKWLQQLSDETRLRVDFDICGLACLVEVLKDLRPNPRAIIGQVEACSSTVSERDRQRRPGVGGPFDRLLFRPGQAQKVRDMSVRSRHDSTSLHPLV